VRTSLLAVVGVAVLGATVPVGAQPVKRVVRVLTYNIHHGEGEDGKLDLPRIAKVIAGAKPDLVAVQEVDHTATRTKGVDQTAELAKLTGLTGRFGKAIDFQGGGYGQAVLSRYPIEDFKVHVLPGEPGQETRIAAAAEVRVGKGGPPLVFVTTHLDHQKPDLRERQSAKLDELFGMLDRPVILAGDLNATPDSPPLKRLAKNWTAATGDKPLLTIPVGKPARQIDYVLFRPADRFKVVEARVLDEPIASDHRPVLAVLELSD
jgi:endonuclease/exonuclease/phosphatase family metal-dependent hydrolase